MRIRPKIIKKLQSLPLDIPVKKDHVYVTSLPVLGYKVKKEFYDVNSVLFLKTGERNHFGFEVGKMCNDLFLDQSFHSTYVLRAQVFLEEDQPDKCFLDTLIHFIRQKSVL